MVVPCDLAILPELGNSTSEVDKGRGAVAVDSLLVARNAVRSGLVRVVLGATPAVAAWCTMRFLYLGAVVVGGGSSCALCAAAAISAAQPSLENLLDAAKTGNSTALRAQLLQVPVLSLELRSCASPPVPQRAMLSCCWQGVDVDAVDGDGTVALMYAAIAGHEECVRALIEGGAKVDCTDPAGTSPLMLAAGRGHVDVCQVLLEGGAKLTAQGITGPCKGQTALDVAVAAFEPAVAALLLSWAEAHPIDGDIMAPDLLAAEADNLLDAAQSEMVATAGATGTVFDTQR